MGLKEELRGFTGARRHYLLLRIADLDSDTARKLAKVKTNTYNSWCHIPEFIAIHRQISDFTVDYRHEAILMLRRDNQLDAVLLEGKIVRKMKEELDSGDYQILKTNLARTVYEKLITDLDATPNENLSWAERMAGFLGQFNQGVGDGTIPETNRIAESQRPENDIREVGAEDNVPAT